MQAVILAGGKGTRLQPYTTILPKPLMPLGDKAILEIVLLQLKQSGFNEFVFTVGYLAELLEAYFGDGSKWGVKIRYSRENEPLGTAGPLTLVDGLADQFLVMNGDVLCDMDYGKLMKEHKLSGADITVCSYEKTVKIDLGVLKIEKDQLTDYIEKPDYRFSVSMGVYVMNRSVVKTIPVGKYYDFPTLIKERIRSDAKISVNKFSGQWFDIGKVEDYQLAQEELSKDPGKFIK